MLPARVVPSRKPVIKQRVCIVAKKYEGRRYISYIIVAKQGTELRSSVEFMLVAAFSININSNEFLRNRAVKIATQNSVVYRNTLPSSAWPLLAQPVR